MFIYTENDTESNRNTQNINIYPKAHQKHENTLKQTKTTMLFSFQKFEHQRSMLFFITLSIFYVEGHTA